MIDDKQLKTIHKSPNQLDVIHSSGSTPIQRNLMRALFSEAQLQAQSVTSDKYIFYVHIDKIKAIVGIKWARPFEVAKYLEEMRSQDNSYRFIDYGDDMPCEFVAGSILCAAKVTEASDYVEFAFNPFLLKFILHPEKYTNVNIKTLTLGKVDYTDLVYCWILRMLKFRKTAKISIRDFRHRVLFMSDIKYSSFNNFRIKVLDPVVKDINEHLDIICSYTMTRETKSLAWTHVVWKFDAKPGCNPLAAANRGNDTVTLASSDYKVSQSTSNDEDCEDLLYEAPARTKTYNASEPTHEPEIKTSETKELPPHLDPNYEYDDVYDCWRRVR